MVPALTVIIIICSILLILVVLSQSSKGGVGSSFGGSGASQMIGVKKSGDVLEKLTWGFAIAIILISIFINVYLKPAKQSSVQTPNQQQGYVEHVDEFKA